MQTHSIHAKTPSNPRCLTLKSPSKAIRRNSCTLFAFFPTRDCNTAGICGGFGDCFRRSPSSVDRDDEGRDDDADAGRFDTSRLALPLADASSVGETITGGSEEQALSRTDREAVCKRRKKTRVRSQACSREPTQNNARPGRRGEGHK